MFQFYIYLRSSVHLKNEFTFGHFWKSDFLEFIDPKLRPKEQNMRDCALNIIMKYTQTKLQAYG